MHENALNSNKKMHERKVGGALLGGAVAAAGAGADEGRGERQGAV
jgi:hypothetical protein